MKKIIKYFILYHILEDAQLLTGHVLRKLFLPFFFKSCGKQLQVRPRVHFESIEKISVGDRVSFNYNSFINGYGNITIGDDCLFGPNVTIISSNHRFKGSLNIRGLGHICDPVIIGNNVWVGSNTTILPGICIGDNVVIGAGSVVTKSVPNNTIAVGNPAKIIKRNE